MKKFTPSRYNVVRKGIKRERTVERMFAWKWTIISNNMFKIFHFENFIAMTLQVNGPEVKMVNLH